MAGRALGGLSAPVTPRRYLWAAAVGLLPVVLGGCGGSPPPPLPGDPRAGLAIFKYAGPMAAGCAACHAISGVSVGGSGPTAGPALDGEGAHRDLRWLAAMLPRHLRQERAAVPPLSKGEQRDLISYLATLR